MRDHRLDARCGPWLRLDVASHDHDFRNPRRTLGVEGASVVMDEDAVRALAAQLAEWLERPKVYPRVLQDQEGP